MKKIFFVMTLIFAIFVTGLMFLADYKEGGVEFYTLESTNNYVYLEGRRIQLEVYSNRRDNEFLQPERSTYTLYDKSNSFRLKNVEYTIQNLKDYYLIIIEADMPYVKELVEMRECYLDITNDTNTLTLSLGSINILNHNVYKLYSFNDLYGLYSDYDGIPILTGCVLSSTKMSNIDSIYIPSANFDMLYSKICTPEAGDNIGLYVPSYTVKGDGSIYAMSVKMMTLIPIKYKELTYIKTSYFLVEHEGEMYYIDQFTLRHSNKDYVNYINLRTKGEIKDAKAK